MGQPVCAVIESMTGARIVHDTLEAEGWSVEIADAQKVKGLAPLAVKTDQIDSKVLATLSQRDLVPAIWLPDSAVREERELARFRLHLAREIDGTVGIPGAANLVDRLFFEPQPPSGLGMQCSGIDQFSYGEVSVSSTQLTITPKDINGNPLTTDDGACEPFVLNFQP